MGRWVDFDKTYRTMDKSFMESVWWVFGELYEKGLVYEGLQGDAVFGEAGNAALEFRGEPQLPRSGRSVADGGFSAEKMSQRRVSLAWTTTPWTLPSNLALAVHPEIDYVKIVIKSGASNTSWHEARLEANFKEYEVLETI